MASLHLPYSSSTPYFSTDHYHQHTFHRTTHLSAFHKSLNQSNNNNFSLSFSLPISYSRNNPIKKITNLATSLFVSLLLQLKTQFLNLNQKSEQRLRKEENKKKNFQLPECLLPIFLGVVHLNTFVLCLRNLELL